MSKKRSMRNRHKLGRNDPCFCGSGLKYKKCHLLKELTAANQNNISAEDALKHWQEKVPEMIAKIREHEEKGIYINIPNSIQRFKGRSFLAVGNKLMYDNNPDATFHQLILRNLQLTLGEKWWNDEGAKPLEEQHFIRRCFHEISTQPISPEQDLHQEGERLNSMIPTGYLQSLLDLAFDVYVLQHKDSFPASWLRRLNSRDQYQGVRYEIAVASLFARMDCQLEFLSDTNTKGKHAEFIATHEETGNKVAVEVKSRHRTGVIHQPGKADSEKAMLGDVENLFNDALLKDTGGLPFLVFIDVNAPTSLSEKTIETKWFADVKDIVQSRDDNTKNNPAKYNALLVTNYSSHYEGNKITTTGQYAIVANTIVEQQLADGPQGTFTAKLMQAAGGYGFVPNV